MKNILWVLVMLYAFLPVQGQQKATEAQSRKDRTAKSADTVANAKPPDTPVTVTVVNEQAPKDEAQRPKNEPQSYFSLLVAANNLPNLLLVAVGIGGVIVAWRTVSATRVAAEATRDSAAATAAQAEIARKALIAQFRPKIQIRRANLIETDDSFSLEVLVINKGDAVGTVSTGYVDIDWQWGHKVEDSHESTTTYDAFPLLPGEDAPLRTNMRDGWLLYRMAVNYADEGRPTALTVRISGELQYVDGNGTNRRTGFWRVWNHVERRFVADTREDREYYD